MQRCTIIAEFWWLNLIRGNPSVARAFREQQKSFYFCADNTDTMKITRNTILLLSLLGFGTLQSVSAQAPSHLTSDLLEYSDTDFRGRTALIHSPHPTLGWVIESENQDTKQTAYRILVASKEDLLHEGAADVWDSGVVDSDRSFAVSYQGPALKASKTYYWAVKTRDNHGNETAYSAPKSFRTAEVMDGSTASYPLEMTDEHPLSVEKFSAEGTFIAFERAAFGGLSLNLYSECEHDTVTIRLGEKASNGRVYKQPKGSISSVRYAEYRLVLRPGRHTYDLELRPDARNTDTTRSNDGGMIALLMPSYTGEVYPFRYCEVDGYSHQISKEDVLRRSVTYPFNDNASSFACSDSVLCMVWEMCKYSIKATSFLGIYVDGDRERIAYEADALIGQLGHYCIDREYSMARRTSEHLLKNPTWPTEWNLLSPLIAWNDYLYTGDARSLEANYQTLKAKTMLALKESNGLISTRTGKADGEFYKSINYHGNSIRDIVDWPQSGTIGDEKERGGEADGFELRDFNTVVNAYHYEAVKRMAQIAKALGKQEDALFYKAEARRIYKQFNHLLFNRKTGHYRDGVGTDHESLHGNMFPLAFGLVPQKYKAEVLRYVKSRRMACSVYGAQFLLDALYDAGAGDYALSLLSSRGERSWYNMLRKGSTITLEAWDEKYKPNLDWNHVWGAAPANLVTRGLFGIVPLEPGFRKFRIKPQAGNLEWAQIRVPSIIGEIAAAFRSTPGKSFTLEVTIPANTEAEVWLPLITKTPTLVVDGKDLRPTKEDGHIKLLLTSGKHTLEVR